MYSGLKHSFGCQRLNAGFSLNQIETVMGHTNTKTTERYAKYLTDKLSSVMKRKKIILYTNIMQSSVTNWNHWAGVGFRSLHRHQSPLIISIACIAEPPSPDHHYESLSIISSNHFFILKVWSPTLPSYSKSCSSINYSISRCFISLNPRPSPKKESRKLSKIDKRRTTWKSILTRMRIVLEWFLFGPRGGDREDPL